jgi:catechol 2,3-dioxygenase-like lactoylglutathione lyase family enzyme
VGWYGPDRIRGFPPTLSPRASAEQPPERGPSTIGYVTLGTNDLARAAKFYDALLGQIGAQRTMESDRYVFWGRSRGTPSLAVIRPHDGKPATVGNGVMVALALQNPEQVEAFHKKALELGAADEGGPDRAAAGSTARASATWTATSSTASAWSDVVALTYKSPGGHPKRPRPRERRDGSVPLIFAGSAISVSADT